MPTRSMLGIVAIALLAAACSDSGTATPPTTTLIESTSAPTTPPATDPITTAPTSTAKANSTKPTSTPPSEVPTTTGVPPTDDLTAEVFDAYDKAISATLFATEDPTDKDRERAASVLRTEGNQSFLTQLLLDLRDQGLRSRASEELPAHRYPLNDVALSTDGTIATFEVCEIDSQILVLITPNGDEDLNDDITSRRESVEMELVDGDWKLKGTQVIDSFPGATECGV